MTDRDHSCFLANIGNSTIEVGKMVGADTNGVPILENVLRTSSNEDLRPCLDRWRASQMAADGGGTAGSWTRGKWIVASVNSDGWQRLEKWLSKEKVAKRWLLSHGDFELEIDVDHPETIGKDRLAAAKAASVRRRLNSPAIIVDSGTAITVDFLDQQGRFQGGAILPGLGLASAALAWGTDQLPKVELDDRLDLPPFVGKNTRLAIRAGVFWGAVGAIDKIIDGIRGESRKAVELFVTGGGAKRLADQLSPSACLRPNLVLEGIGLSAPANLARVSRHSPSE